MKPLSGKRIGQSGYELILAIFFSFFIHAAIVAAAMLLYAVASPKMSIPPFYSVKLVGLPAEIAPSPAKQTAPLPQPTPSEERKAEPKKIMKATPRSVITTVKKSAMPEFSEQKQKPKQIPEETKISVPSEAQPRNASVKAESGPVSTPVPMSTPQGEFKYDWYLFLVKDRIGQNWRPPPDAKDAKARVIFAIGRSGGLLDVSIDRDHSAGSPIFMQAAQRAIESSTFPPLPEDFGKQSLEFSVDLMAK